VSGQGENGLDALALDVVRSARSELIDAPTVTLDTWPVGDAVVILLRYNRHRSPGAQLHHAELTKRIGATIARLTAGRLELRGSSYSPHRRLSALAFAIPDGRQYCPRAS
jgi:hypothetical protein